VFHIKRFAMLLIIAVVCLYIYSEGVFVDNSNIKLNKNKYVSTSITIDDFSCEKEVFVNLSENEYFSINLETITLNITNHMQKQLVTNAYYNVQTFIDGAWYSVPLNIFFNDVELIIEPDSTRLFHFDIFAKQNEFASGKYQLTKEIILDEKRCSIVLEFIIERAAEEEAAVQEVKYTINELEGLMNHLAQLPLEGRYDVSLSEEDNSVVIGFYEYAYDNAIEELSKDSRALEMLDAIKIVSVDNDLKAYEY